MITQTDPIKDFIRNCWKGTLTIIGIIAIVTTLTTFYNTLATSADLNKVKTETQETIQQLKKSIELDRDITRLNQITDSLIRAKILLKTHPRDKDLQEDIETLKKDKTILKERIEKR